MEKQRETATLAGGCFWCLEPVFDQIKGVIQVVPGYTGGEIDDPTYDKICTGTTGHAEAVQIVFDPNEISFERLLEIFFSVHDPTTLNRQGADVGTQYRSAIFFHNQEQWRVAEDFIQKLNGQDQWNNPVVTQVKPFTVFYPAEDYHHGYYRNNPEKGYCRIVIEPKLTSFTRKHFSSLKGK
ncbi:peptide-methionine (S)-S-oxide reductase MsrA [Candidatus Contubernalis alkaliaceticus]|uniref:peptide-methionine (S)-S-oxide reductase MsrA n=1 Tax=Candidatus Contubernalis alkaliaceticus TaxID=338645 RepID=UPI001F4C38C4|nr:peptide-methionine (S)-S-oxide reductase MsrA [Candidatus Contubernalis alkalaceticus]UNC91371.1 peptide-methionine (S)-S-oxide reductase MsrA [Candidatus Contubernalis alkalaceticus]